VGIDPLLSSWGIPQGEDVMDGPRDAYAIDRLMAWRWGNLCYYLTIPALLWFSVGNWMIDDVYRAVWAIIAALIAALPAIVEWRTRWVFPWPAKFLIGLALFIHIGGGMMSWYFDYFPIYDKIAHLVSGMTIALIIFLYLLYLEYRSTVQLGRRKIVFLIVSVTLFFGFGWEFAEYLLDVNLLSTYFVTPWDSFFDTIFNILGTGYIAFHANEYLKLESPAKVFTRFVKRGL
jgi:hypothetical protein